MAKTIGLHFGALVPKLKDQLKEQGVKLSKGTTEQFQGDADALVRLHLRHVLTDSMADTARKKLMKEIVKSINGKR